MKLTVDMRDPSTGFVPSAYQQALFDWIQNGEGSAIVEAVAGSGKTTTIVQALNLIPTDERAIFLAFNRAIAEELKARIPAHAQAATFHSAGLRAWKSQNHASRIDGNKVRHIIRDRFNYDDRAAYGDVVANLVSLAKQSGIGCLTPDIPQAWEGLIDHFDLIVDDRDRVIQLAQKVLDESIRTSGQIIDFDDMIYMTIHDNVPTYRYDWVFVDEAQDTNGVRRELAKRLLKKTGRLVAVGDSHQAIYGFTGADSDAIELIRDEFDCETFPLSICYRSAKAIVNHAKAYVPEIESSDSAPEGIVKDTTYAETPPRDDDAILCRNTAPLVTLAYELIANGQGCRILGRDIGQGLIRLIDQMKAFDLDELHDKLMTYCSRETTKLRKAEKESRAQSLEDKVECIYIVLSRLSENEQTIEDLKNHINQIFQAQDNRTLLTLCTVHKAKGLEWNRVFVHMPGLMPSRYARTSWQINQEVNLQYVAATRAKRELYYVNGGK